MNTSAKRKIYVSPKVEVHDVEVMAMLAASPIKPEASESSIEDMEELDWSHGGNDENIEWE